MNRSSSITLGLSVLAACALSTGSALAVDARLSLTATNGAQRVNVHPGDQFSVKVAIDSAAPGFACNAALSRAVLTRPGIELLSYSWTAPWTTGAPTDYSLRGLTLPVAIYPETLQGPGYPIATNDVEFGNFLMVGSTGAGEYARMTFRVPASTAAGTVFYVIAYPDQFTQGFVSLDVQPGLLLEVDVVSTASGIPGDLNNDGHVDGADLAQLLGMWGTSNPVADLNGDAMVNGGDLGILLTHWG